MQMNELQDADYDRRMGKTNYSESACPSPYFLLFAIVKNAVEKPRKILFNLMINRLVSLLFLYGNTFSYDIRTITYYF